MVLRRDRAGSRPMPDLSSLITRRHEALRAQMVAAHSGKVDGVHQARVASRRLREVVPVLAHGLDEIALTLEHEDAIAAYETAHGIA